MLKIGQLKVAKPKFWITSPNFRSLKKANKQPFKAIWSSEQNRPLPSWLVTVKQRGKIEWCLFFKTFFFSVFRLFSHLIVGASSHFDEGGGQTLLPLLGGWMFGCFLSWKILFRFISFGYDFFFIFCSFCSDRGKFFTPRAKRWAKEREKLFQVLGWWNLAFFSAFLLVVLIVLLSWGVVYQDGMNEKYLVMDGAGSLRMMFAST